MKILLYNSIQSLGKTLTIQLMGGEFMESQLIKISTTNAPEAVGPYSQAIGSGNFIFTSGQIPFDPKTNQLVGDSISEQTEQCMKNLIAILAEARLTVDNLVKTNIFVTDISKFDEVNKVYQSFFTKHYPARSCVEVKGLPKGVLVEVEAIAVK